MGSRRKEGPQMSFQERLIWALLLLLVANFVMWWVKGNSPDPGIVVSGLMGLIGAVWGTGEVVNAVKRRGESQSKQDETSGDGSP